MDWNGGESVQIYSWATNIFRSFYHVTDLLRTTHFHESTTPISCSQNVCCSNALVGIHFESTGNKTNRNLSFLTKVDT